LFIHVRRLLDILRMARGASQILLSGGGASLALMYPVAERVLGVSVSVGVPRGIQNWPEDLQHPAWGTVAGLAIWSAWSGPLG
jgi:cell division ATPase FtsA